MTAIPNSDTFDNYYVRLCEMANKIIALRVGDAYEIYGVDAEAISPHIGLSLTKRADGREFVSTLAFPACKAGHYAAQIHAEHGPIVFLDDVRGEVVFDSQAGSL
jgi:DNA mismatch repair ATPase MutS